MPYQAIAANYTWWRGDTLPALAPLPGMRAVATEDLALLADLHQLDRAEMAGRFAEGSQPYVALIGDTPAAYGWSATRTFGVVDAGLHWTLRPGERGLWDFATLPAWRGRGIYPRLLQAIIAAELAAAARFWIGHQIDNLASERGIRAAGFQQVNITAVAPDGQYVNILRGNHARGRINPMLQNMPIVAADCLSTEQ